MAYTSEGPIGLDRTRRPRRLRYASTGHARRWSPVAAVILVMAVAGCVPPPGHSLDQYSVGGQQSYASVAWAQTCNGVTVDAEVAQTFTAGRTGLLDQVSLAAWPIAPGSQTPFQVTIRTLRSDGAPSATVNGSGSYIGPGSTTASSLVDIPLSSPAFVVSGHQYAVVASSPSAGDCTDDHGWSFFGKPDSFTGGQAWWRGTAYSQPDWTTPAPSMDYFFQTWVLP